MKLNTLAVVAGAVFCFGAAQAGGPLWYNGDFDQRNGGNVGGFAGFDSRIYDDFNVDGAGWDISTVFIHVISSIPQSDIQTFSWEIRSGVGPGTGGTLLFSGVDAPATVTTTGNNGFGRPEYDVRVSGLTGVILAPGTYWLGGKVGGAGSSNDMFVSTTSGANSIGSPGGNNGNSFWDSTSFGISWQDTQQSLFGAGTWDLSMGVEGTAVPEPGTFVAIGLGLAALVAARRRK